LLNRDRRCFMLAMILAKFASMMAYRLLSI
jgi:hypothetical protein